MRNESKCFAKILALSALSLGTQVSHSAPTPSESILALSKSDHTLAIVDASTLQVVSRIPVGPDPHEIAVARDGKTAYVSNMGNGQFHQFDVVDLTNQMPLAPIDTGSLIGLHGLAVVAGKLWFTAQGAKAVGRLDPLTGKIEWVMGTGQDWTHMIVVSDDARKVYTANVGSGTVSILENVMVPPLSTALGYVRPGRYAQLDWVQTVVPTAAGNEGIDLSPNGKELWTASPVTGQLFVIDTAAKSIVATIDAKIVGANRLKFTHDGRRVLISNFRNGDLVVFDTVSRNEIDRVDTGKGASGVLIAPDDSRAFVACTFDNYVAVVDMARLSITHRLDVGGAPDGLAWATRSP